MREHGTGRGSMTAWAVSLAATAASTYALDAFAAVTGAGLVASGVLAGAGHRSVVVFLVASYVVWVFGLRANLRANGALLATTGTSTNVLSKLAHDITRRRFGGGRAARVAAAVAYTGTEVAKEVPYYTAAFGAAVTTDAITADFQPAGPFMIGVWEIEPANVDGVDGTRYTARGRHWTEATMKQHEEMGFVEGWGACADQLVALCEGREI
jgi:hypothetical protein